MAGDSARDSALYRVAKRLLDLGLSSIGLVVLAPVFAVVALAIRLDSRGPVIFRQQRVGRAWPISHGACRDISDEHPN